MTSLKVKHPTQTNTRQSASMNYNVNFLFTSYQYNL